MNFIADESPRKLRGGYYTPPEMVRVLVRFALEAGARRVLEPACGDGAFVRALDGCEVVACELDPDEARKAQRLGAKVHTGDFLAWALDRLEDPPDFDAAVGNPPFIRYQYLPEPQQARAEALFTRLGLPFTRHANAWGPFVVAALSRLREGGRLAMVVPAEILHVLHARGVRRYLVESCTRIRLVEPEDTFAGTLQGVVLLLCEKGRGPARLDLGGAPWSPEGDKWMPALLTARERAALAELGARTPRFRDLAAVDVGIVTGANHFFLVTDEVVRRHRLHRFAHPMFGRSEHVRGVVYSRADHEENRRRGLPTNFLWFDREVSSPYLKKGEAEGLHRRYKCRVRTPWYTVPSVYATPIGMLKRSHDFPRLIWNRAGALTTDTAYRIRSRIAPARLVASFVNSLTALSAELEGRHYGGGVLELVPSEIENLLVPLAARAAIAPLDSDLRAGRPAEDLVAAQDRRLRLPDAAIVHEAWLRLRARRQRTSR